MSDGVTIGQRVTLHSPEALHQIGRWVANGDTLRTNDRQKWLTVTGTHERCREKFRRPKFRDTIELSGNGTTYHLLQWVEEDKTGPILFRKSEWEATPDELNPYQYPYGGQRIEAVELGIRYGQSPLTGHWYRLTEWDTLEGGNIQAIDKEKVSPEQVPQAWIEQTEGRVDDAE